MMSLYDFFGYIGYFFYLIVFLIIAIIFAKKLHAWIWYSIGAILALVSLVSQHISCYKNYGSYTARYQMTPYWSIYAALLLISALIIFYIYLSSHSNISDKNESENSKFSEILSKIPTSNVEKTWECKKCGSKNSQNSIHCKNCGEYK